MLVPYAWRGLQVILRFSYYKDRNKQVEHNSFKFKIRCN